MSPARANAGLCAAKLLVHHATSNKNYLNGSMVFYTYLLLNKHTYYALYNLQLGPRSRQSGEPLPPQWQQKSEASSFGRSGMILVPVLNNLS